MAGDRAEKIEEKTARDASVKQIALWRKRLAMRIMVFVSGACLMSVEMSGAKLLDSIYGSTIYVWGAVISLIMLALAGGYFFGGRIADKRPNFFLLSAIAAAAGLFTIALPYLAKFYFGILPESKFGLQAGPLIAAAVLFLLPCFLYGIVSPFAVRLTAGELSGVGGVAGRLYSISTLGSIAGTLLTSFVLLAHFGKNFVLLMLGAAMIANAVITLLLHGSKISGKVSPAEPDTDSSPEHAVLDATAPSRMTTFALYLVVFYSGAALMALEMCGARILESEYGSTIYLWGAVIGLFMGSLSLGYFLGGKLADRFPRYHLLVVVLGLAGAFTAFLPFMADWYLKKVSGEFGIRYGPLLASLVLFTFPALMFGMVSPFAIRLGARKLEEIGRLSGKVYAMGTVGSIIGTLLVSFVLVTVFGKKYLTLGIGISVIAVGIAARLLAARGARQRLTAADRLVLGAFAVYCLGILALAADYDFGPKRTRYPNFRVVYAADSAYNEISVQDNVLTVGERLESGGLAYYLNRPEYIVRYLKFNRHWESGVFPWREGRLIQSGAERYFHYDIANAVHYTDLFSLAMLYVPDPGNWIKSGNGAPERKRVLFIGGGGGIGPEQFCAAYPNVEVEVAEIDPFVVGVCYKYFGVRQGDKRLQFHIGDGRLVLEKSRNVYDMIILDAFSSGGRIPGHLTTREFLEMCRSKLRKDGEGRTVGLLVSNLITGNKVDRNGQMPNTTRILSSHVLTVNTFNIFDNISPFVKIMDRNYDYDNHVWRWYITTKSSGTYNPYKPDNVIVVCWDDYPGRPKTQRELEAACRRVTSFRTGKPPVVKLAFTTLRDHTKNMIRGPAFKGLSSLPGAEVLTDDFSPTDVMVYPQE